MSAQPQLVVKQERHDEAEIRELANKIVEANKAKMAAANARPVTNNMQPGQVNNILGFLTRKGATQAIQRPAVAEDKKDDDIGKFGWITLGKTHIPYIFRQGEKFCSVKMVEQKVLNRYLNYLHQDIYSCTCIRSYFITEAECRLLTEINSRHCDHQFGREVFTVRDLVVRVSDAIEFYNFLDVCYSKLMHGGCTPKDRCGFIRINKESVVPYTVRGDSKFVPLFYFEGETDNLKLKAEELEGWDLAYLKFCCKVQGIRNELFANETCAVISLNDIKSYFPPGTGFEDYWPSKVVDSQLLVASKGGGQNGMWTRQPPAPPPIAPKPSMQPRRSPAPATQASASLGITPAAMQAVCNGWAGLVGGQPTFQQLGNNQANQIIRQMSHVAVSLGMQMGNNASTQSQTSRGNQRAHPYYTQNSLPMTMSSTQAPPPLVRATVAPHSLGTGTYTSSSLPQQNVAQSFMMGLAEHGLMPPPGSAASYSTAVQQSRVTPQQVVAQSQAGRTVPQVVRSVQQQQQQQQQPVRTVPPQTRPTITTRSRQEQPSQQPPPLIPVNGSTPNNNARYGPAPTYMSSMNEVIDLSSPPRSPAQRPNTMGNGNTRPIDVEKKLTIIPDTPATGLHTPFKVSKALVEGIMVPCINMKPYVYTDLLVTLPDLVEYLFPKHSVSSIKHVLELLGLTLFKGNRQQMHILQESGKCQSVNETLPLVEIRHVMQYMPQIKYMCKNNDDSRTQAAKRQRTS